MKMNRKHLIARSGESALAGKNTLFTPRTMALTGLFSAVVCVATLFFKVNIPLGYAHLGNGFLLLGCAWMGNPYAVIIGGVGSALERAGIRRYL